MTSSLIDFVAGSALLGLALAAFGLLAAALEFALQKFKGKLSPFLGKLLHSVATFLFVLDMMLLMAFATHHAWHAFPIKPSFESAFASSAAR